MTVPAAWRTNTSYPLNPIKIRNSYYMNRNKKIIWTKFSIFSAPGIRMVMLWTIPQFLTWCMMSFTHSQLNQPQVFCSKAPALQIAHTEMGFLLPHHSHISSDLQPLENTEHSSPEHLRVAKLQLVFQQTILDEIYFCFLYSDHISWVVHGHFSAKDLFSGWSHHPPPPPKHFCRKHITVTFFASTLNCAFHLSKWAWLQNQPQLVFPLCGTMGHVLSVPPVSSRNIKEKLQVALTLNKSPFRALKIHHH